MRCPSSVASFIGAGAKRNDFENRSSLCRSAVSARRRGSRSAKVKIMQRSSPISTGLPATITSLEPPSARVSSASVWCTGFQSDRRALAMSRCSTPSRMSSS